MTLRDDPIVEEVRQIRERYLAAFDHDLQALFEDIKHQEAKSSTSFVSYPARNVLPLPVEATEAQLEAVALGGEHIYWDELDQDFRISDLKAGIYGREPWMAKIQQQMAIAS